MRRACYLACFTLASFAVPALAMSVADVRLMPDYPWTEPVIAEGQLIPAGQPMYLQNLPAPSDAIIHLGVIMADDRGTCSLTAHRDMASGAKELGSVQATGHAEVSRLFAELALRVDSLDGAWFAVTCDTPAYAYADILASDENRVYFVDPSVPSKGEVEYVPNFTNEQVDNLSVPRH